MKYRVCVCLCARVCNPDLIFNESSGAFPSHLPPSSGSKHRAQPPYMHVLLPFKHILWKFEQFRDVFLNRHHLFFFTRIIYVFDLTLFLFFLAEFPFLVNHIPGQQGHTYHFFLNFPKPVFQSPGLTSAQPDGPFPLFDQE